MREPAHPSPSAASRKARLCLLVAFGFAATASLGSARAEPPIQNQRDANCREVARTRVFQTPDPQGVGPYEIGRQIYQRCMGQGAAKAGRRSRARR